MDMKLSSLWHLLIFNIVIIAVNAFIIIASHAIPACIFLCFISVISLVCSIRYITMPKSDEYISDLQGATVAATQ
jgi:hypothetical protein